MTEKRELTKPSGNALQIYAKDEAEAQRQIAQTLTSPSVNAALVISASAPQIVEIKDRLTGTLEPWSTSSPRRLRPLEAVI